MLKKLKIVIHPQSYIHAIVQFNDGMMKIVAHETTMKIPIFNSIYDDSKNYYNKKDVDLEKINTLNL